MGRWRAHLSLASHELYERADLRGEVLDFARALPVTAPTAFTADVVQVFATTHPTWAGRWWAQMTWRHVRSLRPPA